MAPLRSHDVFLMVLERPLIPEAEIGGSSIAVQPDGLAVKFRLYPAISSFEPQVERLGEVDIEAEPGMRPPRKFPVDRGISGAGRYLEFREVSADADLAIRFDRAERQKELG